MRVVIADDHAVVRIGLRTVLQKNAAECELVGEATSGSGLLSLLAATPCDAVIVGFQMPEDTAALDGVQLLRELRRRFPNLRIIVLTMLRNIAIFRTMYKEGVEAVVEKADPIEELLLALRSVRAGRMYVARRLREQMMTSPEPVAELSAKKVGAHVLSMREAEVVRLLAQGLSVSEVARITHRSVKTISWQKHSAMTKLGLSNDQQLFDYARTSGLL